MKKLLREFKDFAVKGNVVDMAVGVMIGGAFGKIVTSVVNDLFMPVLSLLTGGINTSALIGFANGVMSILKDNQPTHVVLAMDPGGPSFRHTAYPPYKAQREKMPEDLAASIPYAFALAEALSIPVGRCEGFEADDGANTSAWSVRGTARTLPRSTTRKRSRNIGISPPPSR